MILISMSIIPTHMEQPKIMRKRVLEGIPPLKWGISEETTGIASMKRIMNYLGENVNYTDLMGMSGAAFHIAFYMKQWCPSSPDMYDLDRSVIHLGYKVHTYDKNMENFDLRSHARIITSINQGIPVLAVDLVEVADWGIIVGYEGEQLLVRTYYDDGIEYSKAQNVPWIVKFVEKEKPADDCCETAIRSLRHATNRFSTKIIYENYANGPHAYTVWMEKLANTNWFESCSKEEFMHAWHTNAWIFNSLYDARIQARKYILKLTKMFPEEEIEPLHDAAEIYRQVTTHLFDNWHYVPFPSWVNHEKGRIEFPHLFEPKWVEGTTWTQQMRDIQVSALEKIKSLEIVAMNKLENFLKTVSDDCTVDC